MQASLGVEDKRLEETVTLYRAVGPGQWRTIVESGRKRFPLRRGAQKYFYPMLSESFARKVASDWNVRQSGIGYVVSFKVRKDFLTDYSVYSLGAPEYQEYRISARDLVKLNENLMGPIELVGVYGGNEAGNASAPAANGESVH